MKRTTLRLVDRFLESRAFAPVVFLLLGFALYANTLPGEFVYDDSFFARNGDMRAWPYLWETWFRPSLHRLQSGVHYRPMTFFTLALNFLVTGESPVWFHLVSVLLHGATCWLAFRVMEKLFGNRPLAWITALLFAFLPIHSESVAYIKARDELLVAFFGFAAWLAFLRATEPSGRRWTWSLAAAALSVCAFLSKESALVLPGVFGGAVLLLHGWRETLRAWRPVLLQACAIAAYFAIHRIAVGDTVMPPGEILYFGQNPLGYMAYSYVPWTAFQLLFIAVGQTFVPWNLSVTYGYAHVPLIDSPFGSWMAPAGVLTLLALLTLVVWPRARRSPLGVGAMAFLVLYFPFSKIPMYQSIDFFAERWLYAPSFGLAMIGGWALWHVWTRWKQVAPILFTAIGVAYLFVLLPQNMAWRNQTTLGESMVENAPNSVISYVFLANDRLQYGRLEEATALITKGLAISRDHVPIHHIAAAAAMGAGQLAVAEQAVQAAEALGGDELSNVILRSTLLAKQHRYQESLDYLMASRWFDTTEHRTRMLLALNLWMLDRHDEARPYFDWDAHLGTIPMTDDEKVFMFETY